MRREDIRTGDVYFIGRAASVQFDGDRALLFRVIRIGRTPTYEGWVWLDGYSLDSLGNAVERRSIFVQTVGLRRPIRHAPDAGRPRERVPNQPPRATGRNAGPVAGTAGAAQAADRSRVMR